MISRSYKLCLLVLAAIVLLPTLPAHAQMGYRAQAYRAAAQQRKADRKARRAAEAASEADSKDVRPDDAKAPDADPGQRGAAGAAKPGAGKGKPNVRSMEGLPPKWVEQLRDRSPEEQQRFMENNERFKSLPPERQAQIRRNLEQWNRLSPEQKNAIQDRERFFESLSPQQRQYVRNNLLPRWQAMPVERRQLLLGRLRVLRDLPPAQRDAKLNDPNFMQGLSPDEQQTLRDLNQLRNPLP
jgi:Protein of unknown function (DUF3106)